MEGHTQGHLKRNREDVLFRIPKTSYFRTRYRKISMTVAHSSEIETKKTFILKEKRLDLLGSSKLNKIEKSALAERKIYIDYLRIGATLAVILLHIAAQNFYNVVVLSFEWQIFNISDSLVRWGVPIFVMISGAFFLDNEKEITINNLYKKKILRIIIALIFWSAVYACKRIIYGEDIKTAINYFIKGENHLWFLYMIIGLYISVPILRKITESEELTKYFLAVSFFFAFFVPGVINFVKCMEIPHTTLVINSINSAISNMKFHLVSGYTFYFILGYYLKKMKLVNETKNMGVILFIVGFIMTMGFTLLFSIKSGKPNTSFYSEFSINVMMMSTGVFLFAKCKANEELISEKKKRNIRILSKYTFGMYLVHMLIIDLIWKYWGINTLMCNPIISIVVITFIVISISFMVSLLLNHIPVVNKYIV